MLLVGRSAGRWKAIGLDPDEVVRIVTGHGHWDHTGQLSEFPKAVLYIQKQELKQIDFFLNYPDDVQRRPHPCRQHDQSGRRATTWPPPTNACARTPVCGYPPQTVQEILGKVLHGKAHIVDGRHQIEPGMIIHPAFRGHTYGSQLLQVNTRTRAARVRQRHILVLDGDPGLDTWRTSSRRTRSSSSSPTRSAMSLTNRRLNSYQQLHRGARAGLVLGGLPDHAATGGSSRIRSPRATRTARARQSSTVAASGKSLLPDPPPRGPCVISRDPPTGPGIPTLPNPPVP